jgi:hypothetical protein
VAPKIWYEDINVAIIVAPNDTFDTAASALQTMIQTKTDENAASVTNAALMKANNISSSTVTVLGFSLKGMDISLDSDGGQPIPSRISVGDVFQIKVEYDIQFGLAQQQQKQFGVNTTTTSTGSIQQGGGSCCVIL